MDENVDLNLLKEVTHQNKVLQRKLMRAQYDLKLLQLRNDVDKHLLNITKAERDRQVEYTRILLDNCPELILFVDVDLQPLMASKEMFNLLGLSPDTNADKINLSKITDKYLDDDVKFLYNIAKYSIESRSKLSQYVTLHGIECSVLHVQVLAEPVIDQRTRNIMGVVLVIHDITENVELKDDYKNQLFQAEQEKERANNAMLEARLSKKEAEEANLAKSKFLAVMTHEIRTPLNSIIGMSEVMDTTSLTQKNKGYLDSIKKSSYTLLSIINELLDFSKAEAGKLRLTNIHYDIQVLLEDVCSVICFSAVSKNLNFTCKTSDDFPKIVYGDDIRLRQVLINILTNSVKYTKEGNINLWAYVQNQSIIFKISDTGTGIKQEDMEKIFLPYEQFNQHDNRYISGTGLGLSITKYLCELMGGDITAESVYKKGSIFIITLPLILGDEALIKKENNILLEAPEAKILVVDNNNINLVIAEGIFSLFKIEIETANSAFEAIEKISQKDYHIVFMDYIMPQMDGTEALSLIKQNEKSSSLVTIALSADSSSETMQKFSECGFDGYLSKPIEKKQLIEILKKWLPAQIITFAKPYTAQTPIEQSLEVLSGIPDINIEFGLGSMGNSQEIYIKALLMFADMISNNKHKLTKYLDDSSISDYYVEIHGIKGVLSSLGFTALSKNAAELESAALNKNTEFCREKTSILMEKMEALTKIIYGSCLKFKELLMHSEAEHGDTDALKIKLTKLSLMLDDFDLLSAEDVIKDICKYYYGEDIDRLIQSLTHSLASFDVPEAVQHLAVIVDYIEKSNKD